LNIKFGDLNSKASFYFTTGNEEIVAAEVMEENVRRLDYERSTCKNYVSTRATVSEAWRLFIVRMCMSWLL
jgi:hypothetical protein